LQIADFQSIFAVTPTVTFVRPCPVQTAKGIYRRVDVRVAGHVLRDQTSVRRGYEPGRPLPGGHSGVTFTGLP